MELLAQSSIFVDSINTLLSLPTLSDKNLIYALFGLLRNLVLPDTSIKEQSSDAIIGAIKRWEVLGSPSIRSTENRDTTVDGVIRESRDVFSGPIVGTALVVLKHLCKTNPQSVATGSSGGVPTSSGLAHSSQARTCVYLSQHSSGLLDLVFTLALKSDDVGIKSEAARIIVNMLKTLFSADPDQSKEVARAQDDLVKEPRVTQVLVELCKAENGTLVGEGIFGLILITKAEVGGQFCVLALLGWIGH